MRCIYSIRTVLRANDTQTLGGMHDIVMCCICCVVPHVMLYIRRNARDLDNIFLAKQDRERGVAEIEQNTAQV